MDASARSRHGRRRIAAAAVVVVGAMLLGACGSSSTHTSTTPTSAAGGSTGSTASPGTTSDTTSGSQMAGVGPAAQILAAAYKGTFSAPPTSGPRAVQGKKIWIISCGQASESCSVPTAGLVAAAKVLGWSTHVFDGQLNPTLWGQGISQAVADGAQGIVAISVDCDLAEAPLRAARAAHIPTVGFFSYDCNDPSIHSGPALYSTQVKFNGFANLDQVMEAWGAAKAAWLIEQNHGHADVIEVSAPSFLVLKYEDEGFMAEMATCKTCSVVDHLDISIADLEGPAAGQKLATALQQHPSANGLNMPNDATFQEYANAVLAQIPHPNLKVMGGECFDANIQEIRDHGQEQACDALPQIWTAWAAMDELNRQFADPGSAPVNEGDGFQVVDSAHNLPTTGGWQPDGVNFEADYTKLWTGK